MLAVKVCPIQSDAEKQRRAEREVCLLAAAAAAHNFLCMLF